MFFYLEVAGCNNGGILLYFFNLRCPDMHLIDCDFC